MTKSVGILLGLVVLVALPLLGGSMIWHVAGANRLDIEGMAQPAGGYTRMGTRLGDSLVAFALPEIASGTRKRPENWRAQCCHGR